MTPWWKYLKIVVHFNKYHTVAFRYRRLCNFRRENNSTQRIMKEWWYIILCQTLSLTYTFYQAIATTTVATMMKHSSHEVATAH